MKNVALAILVSLLLSDLTYAQCTLEIEISEIKSNTGYIMFQLLGDKQNVMSQQMISIKNNRSQLSFNDLKPGIYAIRYYHDENLNCIMEKNMVGKPTEGYGFSNNVTGKFGPPPFEKWLFTLNENKKITLKPSY